MAIEPTGENLMFIISQPRSGSTLLQKILGTHSEIQTSVEPWLVLPLVYLIRDGGVRAEYNYLNPDLNTMEFLNSMADGKRLYMDGVRSMMSSIYTAAITRKKKYFLDKTPRYYLIIPELAELFPRAKFILLFRNPLAVLASMHSTWRGAMGLLDSSLKLDLLKAPKLLIEGKSILDHRAICVNYESLVANPEKEVAKICDWLSIPYETSMIEYGAGNAERWGLGDQITIYENSRPTTEKIDIWIKFVQSAQNWRYADSYLKYLGQETVSRMGYSYGDLKDYLDKNKPAVFIKGFTLPFLFSMSAHKILRKFYLL